MSFRAPDGSSSALVRAIPSGSLSGGRAAAWVLAVAAALPGNLVVAQVSLVSRAAASASAVGGESATFGLSADGRYAAFQSESNLLVPGTVDAPGTSDAFVFDRELGTVELVSNLWSSPTTAGNGESAPVQLSANGRFLLFLSAATDLVAGGVDSTVEPTFSFAIGTSGRRHFSPMRSDRRPPRATA